MESKEREDKELQTLPHRMSGKDAAVQWVCPHCTHSLCYSPQHEEVAKLAMVSHLVRCHGLPYWHFAVNMKDLKEAAEQYFSAGLCAGAEPAKDCVSGYLRFSP